MRRRPIGQILVEKEAITEVDLAAALAEQVLDIQEVEPEPRPVLAPVPKLEAPSPLDDPETKLESVEAILRERQRAFMELFSTAESLRMRVARLEDQLEERNRELSRLRLRPA